MSEYIHLIGTEEIARGANNIVAAAREISSAVSYLDSVINRHQQFMDQWLDRLERAMEKKEPA